MIKFEIVELATSCKNTDIADICKNLGIVVEMTKDTMLQELTDEFNDKYKMLTFATEWEIRRDKTIVAEYIGGSVAE